MPHRRPSAEHQEAVSRRLALLGAELQTARPDPTADGPVWWTEHTRLPPDPLGAGAVVSEAPGGQTHLSWDDPVLGDAEVPAVPVPGRHASRRPGRVASAASSVAPSLPATLRGRMALGPAQVAVVAVLVTLGLAVTCWWVVRGDAAPAAGPAPVAVAPTGPLVDLSASAPVPSQAASPAGAPTSAAVATVTVDVAGKVRRPGIAVLDPGARVVDALEAAGGVRAGVDLSSLNLARPLVDGEQILVGRPAPTGAALLSVPPTVTGTPAPGVPTALVNLNTATEAELDTLPDVGPVTAQSILAWRQEHGGFSSVDELLEVSGIGDATLQKLAPLVTV